MYDVYNKKIGAIKTQQTITAVIHWALLDVIVSSTNNWDDGDSTTYITRKSYQGIDTAGATRFSYQRINTTNTN